MGIEGLDSLGEPNKEPSCPWARDDLKFDWDEERVLQKLEGRRWIEVEAERKEREWSIQP